MYSSIFRKPLSHLILLLLIALVAGCDRFPPGTVVPTETVMIRRVVPSGNPPKWRVIATETITQNNCAGSADLSSTIERSHSIAHILEIGAGMTLNASGSISLPEIGDVQVGSEIAAKYGVSYGQEEFLSRSLSLSAKQGTNMLHTIVQVEHWETGELILVVKGTTYSLPYSLLNDFSLELVESKDMGCGTSETPTPTLGTIARIAVLNVKAEAQSDGTTRRTAQLSIEALGYGDLQLTAPDTIELGESGVVRLTLTPDSALDDLLPVSIDSASAHDPSQRVSINDRIQVYPVMIAELMGVNFEISPGGQQVRAVMSRSQVVWTWSITARAAGKQSLVIALSVPVRIDETDEVISAQLKEIAIQVSVKVTPAPLSSPTPSPTPTPTPVPTPTPLPVIQQIGAQLIDNSAAILIALIPALVAAYVAVQNSKRETNIKTLEMQLQIEKGKEEREKLEREVVRLRSIRWWQFWRR